MNSNFHQPAHGVVLILRGGPVGMRVGREAPGFWEEGCSEYLNYRPDPIGCSIIIGYWGQTLLS
jgi:hypothetical protein